MTNRFSPEDLFTNPKSYTDPNAWHAEAARLRREDPVCRIEGRELRAVLGRHPPRRLSRSSASRGSSNTQESVLMRRDQQQQARASGPCSRP
jgi:hypothetical protein